MNVDRRAFLTGSVAAAATAATPAPSPVPFPDVIGKAKGLDRVVSLVRDLDVARNKLERLGFSVTSGERFQDGAANEYVAFADTTSLEFSTVGNNGSLKHDLRQREGPHYAGIEVENVLHTGAFLRQHGFEHGKVEDAQLVLPKPLPAYTGPFWFSMDIAGQSGVLGALTFTEYARRERQRYEQLHPHFFQRLVTKHPNGALRLSAAWFAVHDLDATTAQLRKAGFPARRRMGYVPLGSAFAQELACGNGALVLFGFNRPGAIVDDLQRWGDHLLGYSVAVADLEKALAFLKKGGVEATPSYEGFSGTSALLAPQTTGGAWIELHASLPGH